MLLGSIGFKYCSLYGSGPRSHYIGTDYNHRLRLIPRPLLGKCPESGRPLVFCDVMLEKGYFCAL